MPNCWRQGFAERGKGLGTRGVGQVGWAKGGGIRGARGVESIYK